MLIIEYSLNKDDYFKFNYYTSWLAPEKKQHRRNFFFRNIIFAMIGFGLPLIAYGSNIRLSIIPYFAAAVLVIIVLPPIYIKWHFKKAVASFLSKPDNEHILLHTRLTISDSGIHEHNSLIDSKYKWEAIKSKAETDEHWYLYFNTNYAIVIPKRFLNENEKVQLKSFLSRNLPLTSEFKI